MAKWRCRIGWHYPALWDSHFYHDEPPDPWWHCVECGVGCFPLRWRPYDWFWSTRLGDWWLRRKIEQDIREMRENTRG